MEGDAGPGQLTPPPPLEADQAAAPQSRLATGRWLTVVCAALVLTALLLTGAGVVALVGHRQNTAAGTDEARAVVAAKECIAATQAPDPKAMVESQRKIVECASADFAPQANLYSSLIADAYETVSAQVKIAAIQAAAEKHHADGSIDVLVALRVKMSNVQQQDQELSYRLRVRMSPQDGTYKINSIDPVGK